MACGWTAASPDRRSTHASQPPAWPPPTEPGRIQLRVPALRAFGGLAPLTASGLAERIGFEPGQIERLCQAIDSTVAALVDPADAGATPSGPDTMAVQFTVQPHGLTVQLDTDATPLSAEHWQALGHRLSGLVTSFEGEGSRARLSLWTEGPAPDGAAPGGSGPGGA